MLQRKLSRLFSFFFAGLGLLLWGTLLPAHSQGNPAADLTLQKSVAPLTALAPGDALQYTLTFSNSGILTATEVLISDTLPILLTDLTVTSTLPLTPTGHAWAVGSLSPGVGGIITLTGHVSPALTSELTFTNTATISTPITDTQPANNTSFVVSEVNLPPIVDASPSITVTAGQVFTLTVSFTDPGLDDTHLAEFIWGDGLTDTVNPALSPFTAPHLYAHPGTYPATVRVWDNDGGQGTASIAVTVLPVEDTVYFQYLPLLANFFGNPMNFVEVFPAANQNIVSPQSSLRALYGTDLWPESVSTQAVILHSFQAGDVTGTLTVTGSLLMLEPARSFSPGEKLQATLTTGLATVLGEEILHPDFPSVWQFQVGTTGGSGFMLPAAVPTFGGGASSALALGDLDQDGDWDGVVTNLDSPATVWLNEGGAFTAHPTTPEFGAGAHALGLGDVDRDGDLDAVLATVGAETVWVNDGAGTFTPHPTVPIFGDGASLGVRLGDVNGDGALDVVVANTDHEPETVWLNDGSGAFFPHPTLPSFGAGDSMALDLGDVDGDFDLDVVVANAYGQPETVWINDGTGGYFPHAVLPEFGAGDSRALALGDLDGDGDVDAVVANGSGEPETVWLNDGAGVFAPHPTVSAFGGGESVGLALGDVDGDGDLDVVVANGGAEPETVWLNDGLGGFADAENPPAFGAGESTAVALGDLDGDGDLDAVVANNGAETVWRNEEMEVVSTEPSGVGGMIAAGGTLTVTFDRAVNPDTVNSETFVVNGTLTGRYQGTFSFPNADQVVFTPAMPFKPDETLWVSLTKGMGDATINLPLHPYVWELRGAASGGTGVLELHPSYPTFDFGDGGNVLVGDLDGDGDLDVIAGVFYDTPTAFNQIWINDGTAGFVLQTSTEMNFFNGVLGDLDGDGDLDVIGSPVVEGYRAVWLTWMNDGVGNFTLFSEGSFALEADEAFEPPLLMDLDGDGDLDTLVKEYQYGYPVISQYHIWLNDGTGQFYPHPTTPVLDCCFSHADVGDVDGDGDIDLIQIPQYVNGQPEQDGATIWLNDGKGNFQVQPESLDVPDAVVYGRVTLEDLDGDHDLDAVMSVLYNGYSVWLNDGQGSFTLHPTTPFFTTSNGNSELLELTDLNGDGFLDAVAYGWAITGDTAEIWLNDGLGNFIHHPINPLIGYGVTADLAPGDFDGDGDVEFITVAAFFGDPDYIWLNQNAPE